MPQLFLVTPLFNRVLVFVSSFDLDVVFGSDRSLFFPTVFNGNNCDNGIIMLAVFFDTCGG